MLAYKVRGHVTDAYRRQLSERKTQSQRSERLHDVTLYPQLVLKNTVKRASLLLSDGMLLWDI